LSPLREALPSMHRIAAPSDHSGVVEAGMGCC
jgi:hypothetical protein